MSRHMRTSNWANKKTLIRYSTGRAQLQSEHAHAAFHANPIVLCALPPQAAHPGPRPQNNIGNGPIPGLEEQGLGRDVLHIKTAPYLFPGCEIFDFLFGAPDRNMKDHIPVSSDNYFFPLTTIKRST